MGITSVAVSGVNSAGCRYSAGIVAWRIHTGTIRGITNVSPKQGEAHTAEIVALENKPRYFYLDVSLGVFSTFSPMVERKSAWKNRPRGCMLSYHPCDTVVLYPISLGPHLFSCFLSFIECVCRACRIQYDDKALHCLLCLLHSNAASLCCSFVAT